MAAGEKPAILWGASFANTLEFGYPLDQAVTYPEPREGSEWAVAPSGEADAWITGTSQLLSAVARWIPIADGTTPEGTPITGWDGATGWGSFLTWARAWNPFRFVPLRTDTLTYVESLWVDPMRGTPPLEDDGTRRLPFVIRSTADTAYTGF